MTPNTQSRGALVSRALALIAAAGLAACASGGGGSQDTIRAPDAGSRMRVAMAAEASGQPDVAVSMYAAAANASPADMEVQARYASALGRNGRLDEAEQVLVRALARRPRDPTLLVALGKLRVRKGSAAEAVEALDQALAQRPRDIAALNARGVALDLMGRHAEAQQSYRTAQAVDPANIPSSNNLAFSLMLSGQSSEAVAILSALRQRAGAPARVSNNLGIAQAATGDSRASQATLGGRVDGDDLRRIVDDLASGRQSRSPDEVLGGAPARVASQAAPPRGGAVRDLAEAGSVGRPGVVPPPPVLALNEPAVAPALPTVQETARPAAFVPDAPLAGGPPVVAEAPVIIVPAASDYVVAGSVVPMPADLVSSDVAQVAVPYIVAGSVRPDPASAGASEGAEVASPTAPDVQAPVRPARPRPALPAVLPDETLPAAPPLYRVALAGVVPANPASARCSAGQLVTRSGSHPTFGRIVFDGRPAGGYDVRTDAGGLSLRLRDLPCTPATGRVTLPRNVLAIRPDGDGGFRIETAAGARIQHFRLDGRIVVDVIDAGGTRITRNAPMLDTSAMTLASADMPLQRRP